jgi:hypothetical protein
VPYQVFRIATVSPSTIRSSISMWPSGNAVRHVLIRSISPSGPMPTVWPPAPWTTMFGEMISWASS